MAFLTNDVYKSHRHSPTNTKNTKNTRPLNLTGRVLLVEMKILIWTPTKCVRKHNVKIIHTSHTAVKSLLCRYGTINPLPNIQRYQESIHLGAGPTVILSDRWLPLGWRISLIESVLTPFASRQARKTLTNWWYCTVLQACYTWLKTHNDWLKMCLIQRLKHITSDIKWTRYRSYNLYCSHVDYLNIGSQ